MMRRAVFRLLGTSGLARRSTSVKCIGPVLFQQRHYGPQKSDSNVHASKSSPVTVLELEESERNNNGNSGDHSQGSSNIFLSSLLGAAFVAAVLNFDRLKSSFTVQAAKAFKPSEFEVPSGTSGSGGVKPPKRRQQFNFIADVVETVGNSVVCIEMKDHSVVDWVTGKPQAVSNGSGFIVKEDGLILTNAHVVVGRTKMAVTVKLHDGRTFSAHVEDVDLNSDLAIVRINARGLPTMPLGSSCQTRIGEWVVALGSPLSLSNTVTAGVVSSVNRKANELGISNNISYIQTDAAITFGNSGGPLVNLDGEVIGINSMKVTSGISFAIPIDYVKDYIAQAESRKIAGKSKPRRRYIGATLLTLTGDLVAELKNSDLVLPTSQGVLVWKVVVGSPAYSCGLQPGDIIYKIEGKDVSTANEIFHAIQTHELIMLEIIRGSSKLSVKLLPEDA